jgi:hypothetical protein
MDSYLKRFLCVVLLILSICSSIILHAEDQKPKVVLALSGGEDELSFPSLDFGNLGLLNVGKAKLIIGYKFNKY